MDANPFPSAQNPVKTHGNSDKMPLTLSVAEIKMILRLRSLQGEAAVMVFIRDGLPHRLIPMPKTEVLA